MTEEWPDGATLPLSRQAAMNLGVPRGYASFAVPLGTTTKMDGYAAVFARHRRHDRLVHHADADAGRGEPAGREDREDTLHDRDDLPLLDDDPAVEQPAEDKEKASVQRVSQNLELVATDTVRWQSPCQRTVFRRSGREDRQRPAKPCTRVRIPSSSPGSRCGKSGYPLGNRAREGV